jgi:hypothetical protein
MVLTHSMTQLEGVNRILRAGQINPVSSVTSPLDRFTHRAVTILEEELRRTLQLGWGFNTDHDFELTAVAGVFSAPADSLSTDILPHNSNGKHIVVRAGVLYDVTNNTGTFTETTLKAKIVRYIAFEDCPLVAQDFIVASARMEFAATVTVDDATFMKLRREKFDAEGALRRGDTSQESLNSHSRYPIAQIAATWPPLGGASEHPW